MIESSRPTGKPRLVQSMQSDEAVTQMTASAAVGSIARVLIAGVAREWCTCDTRVARAWQKIGKEWRRAGLQ
eukprot:2262022-Pleurochrysis_carterae.AAC.1